MGLVIRQCVHCLVALIPTLIECNQETIVQGEGEASLMASTSNSPAAIAALNEASEGSSYGGNDDLVFDGLPDGWDLKGASSVASSSSLVPLVAPGRSDCQ